MDDAETVLTPQNKFKGLRFSLSANGPPQCNHLLTSCIDVCYSRAVEMWSITKLTELRNRHGMTLEASPFELIYTFIKSLPLQSIGSGILLDIGTKRRVITALFGFLCFFVCAGVDTSPFPEYTGTTAAPEKQHKCQLA